MLSKTIVHVCARCGSEKIRKNGHAINGAQRAKCLDCERTFILEPAGPRYDQSFKEQVLAAYQDRMSTRAIRRTFGVCHQTLMRWVGEKSGSSARLRGHALAQPTRRRARTQVNSGALCRPKRSHSGCGWRFAAGPARSWAGVWEIAANKVRLICVPAWHLPTDDAPPAAIFGGPTKQPFQRERTAAAPRPKAKPATSNAGFVPCASASAAWFAKPCPSPSAPKTTWTPSTCSSPPTISPSNSEQQRTEHYPGFSYPVT